MKCSKIVRRVLDTDWVYGDRKSKAGGRNISVLLWLYLGLLWTLAFVYLGWESRDLGLGRKYILCLRVVGGGGCILGKCLL